MAKVDLRKTVYNKDQFNRVTGGRDFLTFTLEGDGVEFTVEDFFNEYENLFLSIPINGPINSHEYLVRKSSELVGFQRTTEDIQPLLDEISNLRNQLLQARQENINLQIQTAGGTTNELNEQFNELLNRLSDPPDFDINIPGLDDLADALDGLGENDEDISDGEEVVLEPRSDLIRTTISEDGSITPGSVDVLANDVDTSGTKLELVSISTAPKKGKVEILTNGVVQYTPNIGATNPDKFEYIVKNQIGQTATGTVNIEIINKKFPPPGGDSILPPPPPPGSSLQSLIVGGSQTDEDFPGDRNDNLDTNRGITAL